ncbi:MAG: hypothetical protein ACE5OZ_14905 [Candidatus Heimdallarchaeota archaeon]
MASFESFLWVALLANLLLGVANIIAKNILANKLQDAMAFYYLQAASAIPIFFSAAILLEEFQVDVEVLIISAISAIFVSIGYFFFFFGLRHEDVSIGGSITSSSRIPLALILGFLVFGEFYGFEILLLIGLIFFGALLTSISEDLPLRSLLSPRNRGAIIFFSAALFWALSNTVIRAGRATADPLTLLFLRQVFIFLILLILYPLVFETLGGDPNSFRDRIKIFQALKWICLYNLVLVIAIGGVFYALGFSLSLTEAMSPMEGVMSLILAVVISRIRKEVVQESHSPKIYTIRALGMLIVVISVGMLLVFDPQEGN